MVAAALCAYVGAQLGVRLQALGIRLCAGFRRRKEGAFLRTPVDLPYPSMEADLCEPEMDSTKVLIMAVVATLTPFLALAPNSNGGNNPEPQTVNCTDKNASVTVSVPNSTVEFVCQSKYTFNPYVPEEEGEAEVYIDKSCSETKPLTDYCPTARLAVAETAKPAPGEPEAELEAVEPGKEQVTKPAATLTVRELPADETAVFYVQCKPPDDKNAAQGQISKEQTGSALAACVIKVTVNRAPNKGVHICKKPSITVNVPDKDSSVQFSCEKTFKLYPADPAKVFKDDCKTLEPLKDMTRTAPAANAAPARAGDGIPSTDAAAPPVYTLKAVKKPPKKKMCYLCAKQDPADTTPEPAESYCAVYVESSARARPFAFGFTPLALILSSVLAMLRLT